MKKLVSSHLWRNWPNSPSDCRSQAGKEDQRNLQQKKLKKIVLSWTGIRNWEYLSGRSLGSSSAIANSAPLVLRRCTRTSSYLLHWFINRDYLIPNVKDHDKKLLQQKEILCQSVSNCVKAAVSNAVRCGATGEVFRQKCPNKRKHLPNLAKFVAFTSNPRLKLFVGIRQKIFTFSSIFVCWN